MVRCWVEWDGLMLGQRVGLMLDRRGWFNVGLKGMVRCWVEGDGSMLGQNDGCFVDWGPKIIGGPKLFWQEQKTDLVGTNNWCPNKNKFGRNKELAPQQKLIWRE